MNSNNLFTAPHWGKIEECMGIRYIKKIDDKTPNFSRLLKIQLFDNDEILRIHNARIDLKSDVEKKLFLPSSFDICSFAVYKTNLDNINNLKYFKFGCLFIIDSWVFKKTSNTKIIEFSKILSNRHLKEHLAEDDRDRIISRHFELLKQYKEY